MNTTSKHSPKPGFRLTLFGCALAVLVVGMGAFTRLVDAGLGCPDWPTCYGHLLWPESVEEVEAANKLYPDMQVEHDKTWPEMIHRYLASALGLLTIVLVAIAWKQRKSSTPFKLPVFLLAFIVLQGMFGMWTVTLKLWPQVVTAHLLGGFTTLALLWLLALRLKGSPWNINAITNDKLQKFRIAAVVGLFIVIVQIALGGWTTSNYAAVACPDIPTCQSQWLPNMDFSQGFDIGQSIGPNYLGGNMDNEARIAIHFSHRIGAIITAVYVMSLCIMLLKKVPTRETRPLAYAITGILLLQIFLGIGNIIFQFPVYVAVAHNLGGAFLLLAMVTLNYRILTAKGHQDYHV